MIVYTYILYTCVYIHILYIHTYVMCVCIYIYTYFNASIYMKRYGCIYITQCVPLGIGLSRMKLSHFPICTFILFDFFKCNIFRLKPIIFIK